MWIWCRLPVEIKFAHRNTFKRAILRLYLIFPLFPGQIPDWRIQDRDLMPHRFESMGDVVGVGFGSSSMFWEEAAGEEGDVHIDKVQLFRTIELFDLIN